MKYNLCHNPLVLLIGVCLLIGGHNARSQSIPRPRAALLRCDFPYNPRDPVTVQRSRRLDVIWQSRTKRDVTAELLPFLKDAYFSLRIRAAQYLGRLESPEAEAPLREMLTRIKRSESEDQPDHVPVLTLQLALARTEARNLHGQAKISKILEAVGWSWDKRIELSRKASGSLGYLRRYMSHQEIFATVLEVLYDLAKKGEDIQPFIEQLQLEPSQRIFVECAQLSPDKEIELILDSFSRFEVYIDSEQLVHHLLELKPRSTELIIKRLQDMRAQPENYRKVFVQSFGLLFRVAARLDDPRVLPLLKEFEADPKPWPDIKKEAQIAIQTAQDRVLLSAPPVVDGIAVQ